ncbi:acetoacetate decarboxylase family protein [Rhodobacteraceae bacterium D3-12]|nr:acetoacetate decarboxylase family protein [Rhodobacteraceae bacterium D3-12]
MNDSMTSPRTRPWNGQSWPRTASGRSSLVEPLPHHISCDALHVNFRADPSAVAQFLPPGLEPLEDGAGWVMIAEMAKVSSHQPDQIWADPSRSSYNECVLGFYCRYGDRVGRFSALVWVDRDWSLGMGAIFGWGKRLGSIDRTRAQRSNPALTGQDLKLGGIVSRHGNRVLSLSVTLENGGIPLEAMPVTAERRSSIATSPARRPTWTTSSSCSSWVSPMSGKPTSVRAAGTSISVPPRTRSSACWDGSRLPAATSISAAGPRTGPQDCSRISQAPRRPPQQRIATGKTDTMTKLHMNRRSFIAGAQGLALGTALAGMPRLARARDLTQMTYLTPFGYLIGFSETMYADTSGVFDKHGLNVTIEGGRGSSMAVQQVTAGRALISRTGGTDLIKAYATDPSIVAVGEIYERDLFFMISSEEGPINSPADIAGKTIGIVSASGATENILDMMLAATDVPADSVNREVVGNAPAAFELVKAGRIAGFIATNDTAFQLRVDNQPVVAWSTDKYARCPGQVYMTSKAQLEEKRETIAAFMAAVHETLGTMLAAEDLQPVLESMSAKYEIAEGKRPDKGLAVLDYARGNFQRSYDDQLASDPASWENAYNLMLKAGLISETADMGFYDDSARALAFS